MYLKLKIILPDDGPLGFLQIPPRSDFLNYLLHKSVPQYHLKKYIK